jgi:hypothetical protein
MIRWLVAFVLLFVCCLPVEAGTIEDLKRSCHRANLSEGKHWLEECLEEVVTLQPVHPAFQTIAPGTGLGFGIGADRIWRSGNKFEYLASGLIVGSPDGSVIVHGTFTVAFPSISLIHLPVPNGGVPATKGKNRIALVVDPADVDAKASVTFRSYWMDAKEQNFYGIGPSSSLSGLAVYGLRQTGAGLAINDPLTSWLEAGLSADFISPRIDSVSNPGAPLLGQLYTPTSAPGLDFLSNFMRYEPYVRFRFKFPGHRTHFTDLRVGYAFYDQMGGSQFSFQRLGATSETEYGIEVPSIGTASHRSALMNFVCPELRGARHCTLGTLTFLGHVSVAHTSDSSEVPFYFQETLGGADIYGNDTLRGFVDYRFRGPSAMLFQADFRHNIWGPFGFLAFYDLGRVSQSSSDLAFDHMRHDIGLGVTISATNRVIMRIYVGFGSGEPIRPNYKFGGVL